jgi:hypothetical protein
MSGLNNEGRKSTAAVYKMAMTSNKFCPFMTITPKLIFESNINGNGV